ncbi:raffinose synthase Sip1 [Camillea tinctor]|nr:raffinose synthase Sip1 [Camillea tinctor]
MAPDTREVDSEFQAIYISKPGQSREAVPKLRARLSSFPPLGQITQLKTEAVNFYSLLEVDIEDVDSPWQIAIWHAAVGRAWEEKLMVPVDGSDAPISLQTVNSPNTCRLYFGAALPVSSLLNFTLKFRKAPDQPWRWIREEHGIDDGAVLINLEVPQPLRSDDLSSIIHGLNPDLKVESVASQSPGTQLWTLEAHVGPADDAYSAYTDVHIGTPWGNFLRYFALVRHAPPWLGPRHGKSHFTLDKDAVMCSFLSTEGKHLVLLGISGMKNVITLFRSAPSGAVMLHVRNDNAHESTGLVLAAIGDNFESAIAAVMYHARTVVLPAAGVQDELADDFRKLSDDVKPEWMENWYDGLGYCTWNALGQRLTDQKLFKAVEALAKHRINITSLIIDDNWQDVDYNGQGQNQRGWKSFDAEPKAFPKGLKKTVAQLRAKLPSIQHVAVWHALLGYWGGICPSGSLAGRYKTVTVDRDDPSLGGPMTVIDKEDVSKFYDDFYRFLSDCGVDGVKTDVQYMPDTWISAKHRLELTDTYLDAWAISALRHFSIKAISCMSQAPQVLFHQQLPRNKPAMLVRNSDDFFPGVSTSHPWHIWTNAHNTLLTQHLNVLPDWDMFQTDHDFAGYHAAARCVSGGPIYITDVPGKHNLNLINQMSGPTPRGKTVIFRPSVLGRTIDHYTSYSEDSILKIGSYHGKAVTGTPILGVFNTRQRHLTEIIPVSRFPGVISTMKYIVRAHNSGKITPVVRPDSPNAHLTVSLPEKGYDIFTAYAVHQFDSETNGKIFAANLGLIGKMTGAAAIVTNDLELQPTGKVVLDTKLKALGILGLYISSLPSMSIERDFMITILGQAIPLHTVSINKYDNHVVNIDIAEAWEEMELQPGWSNEVEVKVYFDIEYP